MAADNLVAPLRNQTGSRRWTLVSSLVASSMVLLAVAAVVQTGIARNSGVIDAQKLTWEQRAGNSNNLAFSRTAVRQQQLKVSPLARTTMLGLMSDSEEIPVSGTRYDDGCDRAAGEGCKGVKMWVPKGAKYLPDPPRPAREIKELEDNGITEPGREESYLPSNDPDSPGPEALRSYDLPEPEESHSDADSPGGTDDLDDWFQQALNAHNYDDPSYFNPSMAGEEESDADTPTMNDVGSNDSGVTVDVAAAAAGSCDDIMDMDAWFECEDQRRQALGI